MPPPRNVGSPSEFVQQGCRPLGGGMDFFLDEGIKRCLLNRRQGRTGITGCAPTCHELGQVPIRAQNAWTVVRKRKSVVSFGEAAIADAAASFTAWRVRPKRCITYAAS